MWLFENNRFNEVAGGVTLIPDDPPETYDGTAPPQGSYYLDLTSGMSLKSDEKITVNSEWMIGFHAKFTSTTKAFFSIDNKLDVWGDISANLVKFESLGDSQTGNSEDLVDISGWNYYMLRYMDGNLSVFFNGAYASTGADSVIGDLSAMVDTFRIGKNSFSTGFVDIDAFVYYDVAFTDTQVGVQSTYTDSILGVNPDPPTPDDYTVLFSHDFDDLGVLARGDYNPNTDPGWNNPNHNSRPLSTMAIVDDGTDTVFAHYYDYGHSGDNPTTDYPSWETGTGTYFTTSIRSDFEGYDELYFSYNMKTSPGFYPGIADGEFQEMKIPGLESENFTTGITRPGSSVRLRWSNCCGGSNYIRWYNKIPDRATWEPLVGDFNDTIDTSGEWHNWTMRVSNNTVGSSNGLIEFFYDGRFVGRETSLILNKDGNQFHKIEVSTSGGGGQQNGGDYSFQVFDDDKYTYYDDFVVWQAGSGDPGRGNPSDPGRVLNMPTECELNK